MDDGESMIVLQPSTRSWLLVGSSHISNPTWWPRHYKDICRDLPFVGRAGNEEIFLYLTELESPSGFMDRSDQQHEAGRKNGAENTSSGIYQTSGHKPKQQNNKTIE